MVDFLGITTIHSTGVNWGQAIAIAGTIVASLVPVLGYLGKRWNKRRDDAQKSLENTIDGAIEKFGKIIRGELTTLGGRQDRTDDRFERVDRKIGESTK